VSNNQRIVVTYIYIYIKFQVPKVAVNDYNEVYLLLPLLKSNLRDSVMTCTVMFPVKFSSKLYFFIYVTEFGT